MFISENSKFLKKVPFASFKLPHVASGLDNSVLLCYYTYLLASAESISNQLFFSCFFKNVSTLFHSDLFLEKTRINGSGLEHFVGLILFRLRFTL